MPNILSLLLKFVLDKGYTLLDFLKDLGEVPDGLRDAILGEKNLELLKNWLKLSARVSSVEEFENQMNEI